MHYQKSRRDFLKLSLLGFGTAVFSTGLMGYSDSLTANVDFLHGVASGDPLSDRVILWTRATPKCSSHFGPISIGWEVATDDKFTELVNSGTLSTTSERDFTIKIDAGGLAENTTYYYRFRSKTGLSPVGKTKTLPVGITDKIGLAVVSCSNFPAGKFHVYKELSKRSDIDAVVHLGDYIYEYQRGGYASANAKLLGREVEPATELLSLSDYRRRYAQYRTDIDLQNAHKMHPFIVVWDDHEVANDSWRGGAENHQQSEGDFEKRKTQALQAYFEWMPIRPAKAQDEKTIFRSFSFGDLACLHMMDTRLIGRDKPLEYINYFIDDGFDNDRFQEDVTDPHRRLLGTEQRSWIENQLAHNKATWQILGQQVLMGRMYLPGAVATQQLAINDFARLAKLAFMESQGVPLEQEDQGFLDTYRTLLALPDLPYNLDAWDAFDEERENILRAAKNSVSNLVVLAGDTHNAWASNLVDKDGQQCGVEFACPSITSPGLETYLGLPPEAIPATEEQIVGLISDLQFANIQDRGYLYMKLTPDKAQAEFIFIEGILRENYQILSSRNRRITVSTKKNQISPA